MGLPWSAVTSLWVASSHATLIVGWLSGLSVCRARMQVLIYAVSAMLSFAVLTVGLRRLDPNRARDKQVRGAPCNNLAAVLYN